MQIITDARDTEGDWLYAFRFLGGRGSPVDWRREYHFMKGHSIEKEEDLSLEERFALARAKVYVHNRTILKVIWAYCVMTCRL